VQTIENTRVLLVEDHRDLAYAADGMSGLHLARTESFDVILLDVMLPGMDGLNLCKRLREQHESTVPILMTTARDELNDKLAGFESGADDYLVKPFDLPELVARIRNANSNPPECTVDANACRFPDFDVADAEHAQGGNA